MGPILFLLGQASRYMTGQIRAPPTFADLRKSLCDAAGQRRIAGDLPFAWQRRAFGNRDGHIQVDDLQPLSQGGFDQAGTDAATGAHKGEAAAAGGSQS